MSAQIDYGVTILPHSEFNGAATASEFLAAFRDPRALAAFQSANARLQTCLIEAGIAPMIAKDDTPNGYFADRDRDLQEHLRSCVVDALEADLDDADFNDPAFDTRAFLEGLGKARAYGAVVPFVEQEQPKRHVPTPRTLWFKAMLARVTEPAIGAFCVLAGAGFVFGGLL
ncbi:hypothetical protein [Shimia ponticola]|uniref:hypothetical protein n=1 Tax=Shimia ponticola TaxID=2582893 RepID=UPI0011BE2BFC|nr:hypothetical protein [Shimia ponticola]